MKSKYVYSVVSLLPGSYQEEIGDDPLQHALNELDANDYDLFSVSVVPGGIYTSIKRDPCDVRSDLPQTHSDPNTVLVVGVLR